MTKVDQAQLFPVIGRHSWLNHAAISAWPQPVIEAARAFIEENATHGAAHYEKWMAREVALRELISHLIGAKDPADITLVRNTSEALNIIAQGIVWAPGDEILSLSNEFPSNSLPWLWLKERGVEVSVIAAENNDPTGTLTEHISEKTRLVAVSSVQYDTGHRLDLDALGTVCAHNGALLCVDAIQHLGALSLDVTKSQIDFIVTGSHKWLMGPEGIGFMWSRSRVREHMRVALPGWRMYEDPFDFERTDITPPHTGRRFETGTGNMFAIHTLAAAIELLLELDPNKTEEALLVRTDAIIEKLSQRPDLDVLTPTPRRERAGIVCFSGINTDLDSLVEKLASLGIFIAKRGGALRISPHFYTPIEQIQEALDYILATDVV